MVCWFPVAADSKAVHAAFRTSSPDHLYNKVLIQMESEEMEINVRVPTFSDVFSSSLNPFRVCSENTAGMQR
jgi:hypothetical protein